MNLAYICVRSLSAGLLFILLLPGINTANTRILEHRFALSHDPKSEFSTRFPVLSSGRIVVEASWRSRETGRPIVSLDLVLLRGDGAVAAQRSGQSPLRLEFRTSEPEVDALLDRGQSGWRVKVINGSGTTTAEVAGTVRITVPTSSRQLLDTQFNLLSSGNAQELPFIVHAPGKLVINAEWSESGDQPASHPEALSSGLTLSLIHPGQSRTYARRQGPSPLRVEHQVTERELETGARWVVRVQNDSEARIRGRLKVEYTPSL